MSPCARVSELLAVLVVLLVALSCCSAASSAYKQRACQVICRSSRLPLAKQLCSCHTALHQLEDILDQGGLAKRWGLDMDLNQGWGDGAANTELANDDDDSRKIFRFGKRAGPQKKWTDDLSMALPWEPLDGATMNADNYDDQGTHIFRYGKRSVRAAPAKA